MEGCSSAVITNMVEICIPRSYSVDVANASKHIGYKNYHIVFFRFLMLKASCVLVFLRHRMIVLSAGKTFLPAGKKRLEMLVWR